MKKIRYLVSKKDHGFYWRITPAMKKAGFRAQNLGKDKIAAEIKAEELNREWDEYKQAGEPLEQMTKGDFNSLIHRFQKNPTFYGELSGVYKDELDREFKLIGDKIGAAKVHALRRKHVRTIYDDMSNAVSIKKANKNFKAIHRLLAFAVEIGWADFNVATGMEKISIKGRYQKYEPDEIDLLIRVALDRYLDCRGPLNCLAGSTIRTTSRRSLAIAISIAYDTSLPRQDILALKYSDFDGKGFSLRQLKKRGDRNLYLPVTPRTMALVSQGDVVQLKSDQHICINEETGKPWELKLFSKAFLKLSRRAGLRSQKNQLEQEKDARTFHDIRRTAMTEMGDNQATNVEIAAFSGHAPNSTALNDYVKPGKKAAVNALNKRFSDESQNVISDENSEKPSATVTTLHKISDHS
tara:strand:- start:246 stop:1475 length:1230 start_codon:yes stop_codon:yes gene_type:complete